MLKHKGFIVLTLVGVIALASALPALAAPGRRFAGTIPGFPWFKYNIGTGLISESNPQPSPSPIDLISESNPQPSP